MKNKLFCSIFLLLPFLLIDRQPMPALEKQPNLLATEIYLYTPGNGTQDTDIQGESQNAHFVSEKAVGVVSLGFSTSNNVFLSGSSGGIQSGKPSGNTLTFSIPASTAIPGFYKQLCSGGYYSDVVIAIGSSKPPAFGETPGLDNFNYVEKIELKLVMITDVNVSSPPSGSDEALFYNISIAYGAIQRSFYEQNVTGPPAIEKAAWSYVNNNDTFSVN